MSDIAAYGKMTHPSWGLDSDSPKFRRFMVEQNKAFANRIREVYFPEMPKPEPEMFVPKERDFIFISELRRNNYERENRPTADQIMMGVERRYGLPPGSIKSKRRSHGITKARREAVSLVAKVYPEWSLPRIGRKFDRDHTTILYSLRKYELEKGVKS